MTEIHNTIKNKKRNVKYTLEDLERKEKRKWSFKNLWNCQENQTDESHIKNNP